MKRSKLPDTLGELILIALKDEDAAYKNKDYYIDMSSWHVPNGKCSVCFAGSVMAGTLKGNIKNDLTPPDFKIDGQKLEALDQIRTGHINAAIATFYYHHEKVKDINVTAYESDRSQWRKEIRQVAHRLIKADI